MHYIKAENSNYISLIHNNIDCYGSGEFSCDYYEGESISLNYDTTYNLDLTMKHKANLNVNFIDEVTGVVLSSRLNMYNSNFNNIYNEVSSSDQDYRHFISTLDPGIYYIKISGYYSPGNRYINMGYPNVQCLNNPPLQSCDFDYLSPITINMDDPDRVINMHTQLKLGINGYVTDVTTGLPLAGVILDLWNSDNQSIFESTTTYPNGSFVFYRDPDQGFIISTDTNNEYIDEIYKDIQCLSLIHI